MLTDLFWWWFWAAAGALRAAWQALPGPWYVKLALVAVCQLIPGCLDELALIAVTAAWRRYQVRRTAQRT